MAVGDALGAPFEFSPVRYGIIDLLGFEEKHWKNNESNSFSLKMGQWTDDCSMGE